MEYYSNICIAHPLEQISQLKLTQCKGLRKIVSINVDTLEVCISQHSPSHQRLALLCGIFSTPLNRYA